MYNLYLDDYRNPPPIVNSLLWVVVKDLESFQMTIISKGLPDLISFGHDLTNLHYSGVYFDNHTGYDAAKWLIWHCKTNKLIPLPLPGYMCHSLNPEGRLRILNLLDSYR